MVTRIKIKFLSNDDLTKGKNILLHGNVEWDEPIQLDAYEALVTTAMTDELDKHDIKYEIISK